MWSACSTSPPLTRSTSEFADTLDFLSIASFKVDTLKIKAILKNFVKKVYLVESHNGFIIQISMDSYSNYIHIFIQKHYGGYERRVSETSQFFLSFGVGFSEVSVKGSPTNFSTKDLCLHPNVMVAKKINKKLFQV